jgi:hypothetical protein
MVKGRSMDRLAHRVASVMPARPARRRALMAKLPAKDPDRDQVEQTNSHEPGRLVLLGRGQALGSGPARFPDQTTSLLPGSLATTRTGLSPAGDDELLIRS